MSAFTRKYLHIRNLYEIAQQRNSTRNIYGKLIRTGNDTISVTKIRNTKGCSVLTDAYIVHGIQDGLYENGLMADKCAYVMM